MKQLKKQSVAWGVTALMILAAVAIGMARAPKHGDSYYWDGGFYLRDEANVLSSRTIETLDQRNEELWWDHGAVIGVATCNYGGDDLYGYTVKQFEKMGLNGQSMLVVLDVKGDNYWLYTGDDVAWDFSDEDCDDYLYDYMEAPFARGDYDKAVLDLTEELEDWYEDYYG